MDVSIRIDYENALIGKQIVYKIAKKDNDVGEINNKVISLLHYVFDELLEWTPNMVKNYITWDLLDWLKLTPAVNKMTFPPELNPKKDLFYIAALLYPDEISYNHRDFVLQVYEKVLSKELNKYPKRFFSSATGMENLHICFKYAVLQKMYDKSLQDIYMYFSIPANARKFLNETKLQLAYKKHYDNAIDLLHMSLDYGERNDFYYHFAKFTYETNIIREEENKAW